MSIITLKELLENTEREVPVKSLGIIVKVKDPTTQDKIDVRQASKKHPLWKEMNELEKATEISNRLALKMLADPKISYENFKKAPSPKIDAIIEAVTWAWNQRVMKFTEKTRKEIRDFLEQQRVGSLKSSTSS